MTQLLPLAITMMAGPQILSAIIFVTGDDPVRKSLAYVAAVALAMATAILVWTGLAGIFGDELSDSSGASDTGTTVQVVLIGLLIAASIKAYLGRETAEPPKWMGKLQEASPSRAFRLGLMLIFLMPSDFVILMTTGVNVQANGLAFWDTLPFIGLTCLIAALPLLFYLIFRRRAMVAMPKLRDWMNANSWLVNIIVYGIFIFLIV